MLHCYHTSGAKFAARRLCLVTETAYYVHSALALRLAGVTVGYYRRIQGGLTGLQPPPYIFSDTIFDR